MVGVYFAVSITFILSSAMVTLGEEDCPSNYFQCPSGVCITEEARCDGNADCTTYDYDYDYDYEYNYDDSDEHNCTDYVCPPNKFQCLTGQCIDQHGRCNGYDQCKDGSDEYNCVPCTGGATLLSTSPRRDMVLCKDKTQQTCEKDFESLCPAGWNLCTPAQFNNRNTGWDYNWVQAKTGAPLGVIYCTNHGTAAHYGFRNWNPVLNTDLQLNCRWGSSRPGCEDYAGWADCEDKDKSALCCAPSRTCGDGLVQEEEDCDDGNDDNMDECLNTCTWKTPWDHGIIEC